MGKHETGVLVVADGLGGLPRGGDASQQMVESLSQSKIKESVDPVVACLESVNESLVSESQWKWDDSVCSHD